MTQPRPPRGTVGGRAYLELRRHAKAAGRDTGELLQLYALEGFLDRLTRSPYAGSLVLKGGVLLSAFEARRPTAGATSATCTSCQGDTSTTARSWWRRWPAVAA